MHGELRERRFERHVEIERDELLRDARLLGEVDQRLAALLLLDLAGARQQRFEIPVFGDQLCGGLDPDAGHARHIVGRIPDQRLHLDHLLGSHPDAGADQLHQVLVGRHDGGRRSGLAGLARIGGDEVVGLEPGLLEAGNVEGANRLADIFELRHEVVRRVRPVRLVGGVELVAERVLGLVEDDREMRRPLLRLHVAQQLPQHVAETEHRVDLQPVGFAVERRQRVIGAENIGGAVDQKYVVAGLRRTRLGG